MLELYHAHISTCSQKVRLCLAEKQLAWTGHPIEFATADHLRPAYLQLNPNGVVPTLVDDGRPVIDSSVICEYLEEIAPQSAIALMPSMPYERARMRVAALHRGSADRGDSRAVVQWALPQWLADAQ